MSTVLVVNSGSSSIKYQFIDADNEHVIAKGLIERIGAEDGIVNHTYGDEKFVSELPLPDHIAGFEAMISACAAHGPDLDTLEVIAVGHRLVQGGMKFIAPTIITDEVVRTVEELSPLAPLHNPPNLLGVQAARVAFPDIPHVGVFDTAFHQTMPPEAYTYAIDRAVADEYGIRRYGYHGTSHKYVSELAAEYLQLPLADVNTIVLHIGNGASATAIRGGKSVDTSMGLTPLEGLVMGSRSGDIDAGIIFHLARQAGMSSADIDTLLNRKSGLVGLFGTGDVRDVLAAADQGDANAQLALDVYCHRLKHYVGAYYAVLGRVDCIVFTAGVGENAAPVRARTLAGLEHMGVRLDPERNGSSERGIRRISSDESAVTVLVVPTNEELEIARQTIVAVKNA
ncbi:MAG: acetate kinase [Thermomicrobiales bacterium]|nr:acetate kinase [Thermomicrobiales bacterium]